jgi:hypothetical protein
MTCGRRWTLSDDQDPGSERRNVKQKPSGTPGGPPASSSRLTVSYARLVAPAALLLAVCGDSTPPHASIPPPAHAGQSSSLGSPVGPCSLVFDYTLRAGSVVFGPFCARRSGQSSRSSSCANCRRRCASGFGASTRPSAPAVASPAHLLVPSAQEPRFGVNSRARKLKNLVETPDKELDSRMEAPSG